MTEAPTKRMTKKEAKDVRDILHKRHFKILNKLEEGDLVKLFHWHTPTCRGDQVGRGLLLEKMRDVEDGVELWRVEIGHRRKLQVWVHPSDIL